MTGASAESRLVGLERFGIRLGLETIGRVLAELGDPQARYEAVLVGGTNGKGSCAALLASILGAAGLRIGLYTSPHLEEVRERVRVDGVAVGDAELAAALDRVLAAGGDPPPTYFEALTAAALALFAERSVDLAVLEVGLGGRLDATNACDPVVSVITSIAHDHEQYLGEGLEAIAREKAGIMRPGAEVFGWGDAGGGAAILRSLAAERGALLSLASADDVELVAGGGLEGQRLRLSSSLGALELDLPLAGAHQPSNLALAVEAAAAVGRRRGHPVTAAAVRHGLAEVAWPGRLETVRHGARVAILDGAHNPSAMASLAATLSAVGTELDLLFAAAADKPGGEMLRIVAPLARRVTLTTFGGGRATAPAILAEQVEHPGVSIEEDLPTALDTALAGRATLLVAGSLFLVGAVRGLLRQRWGVPPPAAEVRVGASARGRRHLPATPLGQP